MGAILGALFSGVWSAIAGFFTSLMQRADEQKLGQKQQGLADEAQQVRVADAGTQRVADAAKASDAELVRAVDDPASLRDPDPDSRD